MRRMVGVLAGVVLAAGSLVATAVTPVGADPGAGLGPIGYTTRFSSGACGLASVDLGVGGALTPIGPPYIANEYGCPDDLAIRAGDPQIWAVITYPFGVVGGSAGAETTTSEPLDAAAIESHLVTIDPATGKRTRVGSLGFDVDSETSGLAFDASGTLWLYGATNDPSCSPEPVDRLFSCLYRLDPATGAATFVARGPRTADTVVFQATATCDAVLASVNDEGGTDDGSVGWLATVNTSDAGLGRAPAPQGPLLVLFGIERDSTGTLRALGEQGGSTPGFATFTVDPTTGVATKVADLVSTEPITYPAGLAIAGLTCPVAVTPTFTG